MRFRGTKQLAKNLISSSSQIKTYRLNSVISKYREELSAEVQNFTSALSKVELKIRNIQDYNASIIAKYQADMQNYSSQYSFGIKTGEFYYMLCSEQIARLETEYENILLQYAPRETQRPVGENNER